MNYRGELNTLLNFSRIYCSSAVGGKLVTNKVDPVPTWTSIALPSKVFISFVWAVRTSSAESNSIVAVADAPSLSGRSFKLLITPHYPQSEYRVRAGAMRDLHL